MSTAPAPPPKHRRPRAIQACNLCRSKKYKCDGNLPCLYCVKQNADCVFRRAETFGRDAASYSISYVKELEKRLELAESTLRRQQSVGSPQPASTSMNNAMIISLWMGSVAHRFCAACREKYISQVIVLLPDSDRS